MHRSVWVVCSVAVCLVTLSCDDESDGMQVLEERPTEPAPAVDDAATPEPELEAAAPDGGSVVAPEGDAAVADGATPAPEGPTRYTCVEGRRATFPESMRGNWVDSGDAARVLVVAATGLSKRPGPKGNAHKTSVSIVRGMAEHDNLMTVRCATLVTTAFGQDGDVCRGSVEIERDQLIVAFTGHKACADELSGVFLREGSSWKTEADVSYHKPVFHERRTQTMEGFNRSETGCSQRDSKVYVPAEIRGVWYDELAEDGTPKSLMAVTATGLAKSSGPLGDKITASMLFFESTSPGNGVLEIGCGDYSGWGAFENGTTCKGRIEHKEGKLTVQVEGHDGCTKALSGSWTRWHGTEVTQREVLSIEPDAVGDDPETVDGVKRLPHNAGPCERVADTLWQSELMLEAPGVRLDGGDWALLTRAGRVALHRLDLRTEPPSLVGELVFNIAAGKAVDGRCEFDVSGALPTAGFVWPSDRARNDGIGGNPYQAMRKIALRPDADSLELTVEHAPVGEARCFGPGCEAGGKYPAELRARIEHSLSVLNHSRWRPAAAAVPEPDGSPAAHGYPPGGRPLGLASGPECEQLFDTQWTAAISAGHGGSLFGQTVSNGLVVRRGSVRFVALADRNGQPMNTGAFTQFNSVHPYSRGGACVFDVANTTRGRAFDGDEKSGARVLSTPWAVVQQLRLTPLKDGVSVALTTGKPGEAICLGVDCAGGNYSRKLAKETSGWLRALDGARFVTPSAQLSGLDGRLAGHGFTLPEALANASSPTAVALEVPGRTGLADGIKLVQDYDGEWNQERADQIVIQITQPIPDEILRSGNLRVRVNMTGFDVYKTALAGGPHLRVLLDNEEPRDWFDPNEQAFAIDGLAPGLHSVRILPVTPWGESIKGRNALAKVSFYVGGTRDAPMPIDWSRPTLAYSRPAGTYQGAAADRILVDFFVYNTRLGASGHKVIMTLDANAPVEITTWAPLYLENLPDGKHRMSMALVGADGEALPGPYNQVERTFIVDRTPPKPDNKGDKK